MRSEEGGVDASAARLKKLSYGENKATNGSDYWQARGSADWERRLAAA